MPACRHSSRFVFIAEQSHIRADINLARALELEARIFAGFFPVRDPAGQTSEREHHGEHLLGDADGAVDDAAVEIHVGVEVARQEILVVQAVILKLMRDVEQRVIDLELFEQVVATCLDDFRARS